MMFTAEELAEMAAADAEIEREWSEASLEERQFSKNLDAVAKMESGYRRSSETQSLQARAEERKAHQRAYERAKRTEKKVCRDKGKDNKKDNTEKDNKKDDRGAKRKSKRYEEQWGDLTLDGRTLSDLKELHLGTHAARCLARAGYHTIYDVISRKPIELRCLPNLGDKTYWEIRAAITNWSIHNTR